MQTEEFLPRFDYRPQPYTPNTLRGVDWTGRETLRKLFMESYDAAEAILQVATTDQLDEYMRFAIQYRSEDRVFWIMDALISRDNVDIDIVRRFIDRYPELAFSILKRFLSDDNILLPPFDELGGCLLRNIIRSSNHLGIASLVGLEKLGDTIRHLDLAQYFDLLWLACLSVRHATLVQETLLVLHEARCNRDSTDIGMDYAHKHGLAIAFDRADEAAEACPCSENGRIRRTPRSKPIAAKLVPRAAPKGKEKEKEEAKETVSGQGQGQAGTTGNEESPLQVVANIRVDKLTSIRIHSHVRLQVSSRAEHSTLPPAVLDATVSRASRGELFLDVIHPLPPEFTQMDWNLYDSGSVATSKAMMVAVQTLATEREECCEFYSIITGSGIPIDQPNDEGNGNDDPASNHFPTSLNDSQRHAVSLARGGRLTLILGPPGGFAPAICEAEIRMSTPFD